MRNQLCSRTSCRVDWLIDTIFTAIVHVGSQEERSLKEDVDSSEAEYGEQIVERVVNRVVEVRILGVDGDIGEEGVGLNEQYDPLHKQV
jgi:hypothetical protein